MIPALEGPIDSLLAGRWDVFRDAIAHLILPSLVLGLYISGVISRVTRSSLLEVLGMDYMRTARAKGLRGREVFLFSQPRPAFAPSPA